MKSEIWGSAVSTAVQMKHGKEKPQQTNVQIYFVLGRYLYRQVCWKSRLINVNPQVLVGGS